MIIFSSLSCISHILLRHGEASLNEGKARGRRREDGREGGGEGEAAESKGEEGGGSVVASAAAVIPLLRGSAAGGCAEGRSVEKTEERRGKERKGVPGQHCNSCSCSSLTGRGEEEKEAEGRKDKAAGLPFFFF